MMCYLCYSSFWIWFYILEHWNLIFVVYFLLNIVILICFSTCFFGNITLCINLLNVTLSNMSGLVYITLLGETDGVTLWKLGRTMIWINTSCYVVVHARKLRFCLTFLLPFVQYNTKSYNQSTFDPFNLNNIHDANNKDCRDHIKDELLKFS